MTESSTEKVTISKSRYERLVNDQKILHALYGGGVDNWEGYHYSLEEAGLLEDDEDFEDE